MGTQYKVDTDLLQAQIDALTKLIGNFPKATFSRSASDADSGNTHEGIFSLYTTLQQTQQHCISLIEYTRDFFQKYLNAVLGNDDTVLVTPSGGLISATVAIQLHPQMGGYSVRQGDYGYFTQPYGYNAGCCAVAYAAGISIVTGKPCDPTQFWYDGYTHYDAGHRSNWQPYNTGKIYNDLKCGHPFQLAYIYDSSPADQTDADHFVLITGIKKGANTNNLQYEDFVALDPATGREVPLNEVWKFNPARITGGFTIS